MLFGNFIAVNVDRKDVVLDIGCGISEIPIYVKELGLENFIGLEPLLESSLRRYPCLVGAMAEDIPLKDQSVDVVLFATSLDHIEDENRAIEEVKRILKPDGRIMFWQGIHDPDTLATNKTFGPIFTGPITPIRLARLVLSPLEYLRLGYRIWKQKWMLANGKPIDNVHFRHYTRKSFDESLKRWGLTKVRELEPPTIISIFVEATVTKI